MIDSIDLAELARKDTARLEHNVVRGSANVAPSGYRVSGGPFAHGKRFLNVEAGYDLFKHSYVEASMESVRDAIKAADRPCKVEFRILLDYEGGVLNTYIVWGLWELEKCELLG